MNVFVKPEVRFMRLDFSEDPSTQIPFISIKISVVFEIYLCIYTFESSFFCIIKVVGALLLTLVLIYTEVILFFLNEVSEPGSCLLHVYFKHKGNY